MHPDEIAQVVQTRTRPVRIRALGPFVVQVDGTPIGVSRARLRALDLLKAILASGPDGGTRHRLAQWLWPDHDGDVFNSLEITIHRLRALLVHRDAILATSGRIVLNPAVCWVDVDVFEAAAARAAEAGNAFSETCQALMLYNGHFLEGEEEPGWVLPRREQLRQTLVTAAERCARGIEQSDDVEAAIDFYRMALARDPINEIFNCGLMRAFARAGRREEARMVYTRLERMVRTLFGMSPSPRVVQLLREIVADEPAPTVRIASAFACAQPARISP